MGVSVTLHQHRRTHKGKTYSYWVLRWVDSDGVRRNHSLGRMDQLSRRQAEKLRVQKQTEFEAKPTRRDSSTFSLGEYLDRYLRHRRNELEESTLELHEQTARYLKGYFGEDRHLNTITRADARLFKTTLAEGKLSQVNERKHEGPLAKATVDHHMRESRTIFNMAVTDDLLTENPFEKLAGGRLPDQEWHYVTSEEFAKLLAASKPGWKLMLGLARWAGLRAEEAIRLPWRLVDLEQRRIEIIAHKDCYGDWTPKDRDQRIIPIGPELFELLRDAYDPVSEMVTPFGSVPEPNIWRDFQVVFKHAGVARYAKPMHSLRKSCIKEWAAVHPAHVVMPWAGHSDYRTTIKHYLKVSQGDFDQATGMTQKVTQKRETGSV
jgi:site-specific recombinase XerC